MSLFKAQEWWSTHVQADEEFDQGSLCVGKLLDETSKKDVIVIGSLNGVLRIYDPAGKSSRVEDLVLEQDLEKPILQVEIGNFVSTSTQPALAVLFPREIVVYQIRKAGNSFIKQANDDDIDQGSVMPDENSTGETSTAPAICVLEQRYGHKLGENGEHFTAYNFTFGPFGCVDNKDFLAVQSMDGQIQVFEQGSAAFLRKLNHMMLPGPLAYVARMDSFLSINSKQSLDCYRYHVLAGDTSKVEEATDNRGTIEMLTQTSWSCQIGESIRSIVLSKVSRTLPPGQSDILLLGDHHLFYCRENGTLRSQRKFDVGLEPVCMTTFSRPEGPFTELEGIMLLFTNGVLHILDDQALIWAARLSSLSTIPVAVSVGCYAGVDGSILVLQESGELGVNYLGTSGAVQEGSILANTATAHHDLSYEELDIKLRATLKKIKQITDQEENSSSPSYENEQNESHRGSSQRRGSDKLVCRIEVPQVRDRISVEDKAILESEGHQFVCDVEGNVLQITIQVHLQYTGDDTRDISTSIQLPPGFTADDNFEVVKSVEGGAGRAGTPLIIRRTIRVLNFGVNPPSLNFSISAQAVGEGPPITCMAKSRLPLFMVAVPQLYEKTAGGFKLTLDSNLAPPPRLATLFDDQLTQEWVDPAVSQGLSTSTTNAIRFCYSNGETATAIISRNNARYRVQADTLEGVWLIMEELSSRLGSHFSSSPEPLKVTYQDVLPLNDYFVLVDHHLDARLAMTSAYSMLNDRTHQLRIVQRRLLARFRDKNATPLGGLNLLFHETYNQVMELAGQVAKHQQAVDLSGMRLSAATALVTTLVTLRFNLCQEERFVLESVLTHHVNEVDSDVVGWEDVTTQGLTYLLKTVLSKQPQTVFVSPELKPLGNTGKFKKYLTMVCNKLSKGKRLVQHGGSIETTEGKEQ